MKEKKTKNEIRSLSPNYVNFLVHTKFSPQDDKEIKKIRAKNREDKKVSGIFNHSKMSNSSRGSMQRSRSNNQLPIISGSDLRTIKEIFEMAKESKIKQSLHRIPIKRLPKSNIIVDKRRKIKSIPKPKKSSISLAPLNYYICNLTMLFEKIWTKYINFLYKVNNLYIDNNTKILNDYPKEEQIILQSTPSKQSSTTTCDRNQDISKFYSNCIIESWPQLPQISHKNLDSSNKKDNKKKHYSKFKYSCINNFTNKIIFELDYKSIVSNSRSVLS